MDSVFEPFLLSLIAGLATGIGGIIVVLLRRVSGRVVGFAMGLASGVMLLVSFNSLFLEATKLLTHFDLIVMFSLGALTIMALDLTIPHIELTRGEEIKSAENTKMFRSGVLIAVGVTLHNLPEGLVVAAGYAFMPTLGLTIAIAIMLHNIPEGVATAIPLTIAGTKPFKVMIITLLSGLAEPVAALVGAIAFSFGTRGIIGFSLAFAAGVMTYITADELIPVAHEYGHHKHTVSAALLLGIILALMIDAILS